MVVSFYVGLSKWMCREGIDINAHSMHDASGRRNPSLQGWISAMLLLIAVASVENLGVIFDPIFAATDEPMKVFPDMAIVFAAQKLGAVIFLDNALPIGTIRIVFKGRQDLLAKSFGDFADTWHALRSFFIPQID
jgi:hypothetical protein